MSCLSQKVGNLTLGEWCPLTPDFFSPEYIAARNAALVRETGFVGVDATDPKAPAGHASGIRTSTRLTSDYRQTHRKQAVDVTPQQVIDCLVAAGVKNWVLMGLHGYVGYLPMPRATQDVDVMIPYSQKAQASKAIAASWPTLQRRELSQVVRFADPADPDADGKPKPVIDLMLPWSEFQKTILLDHVLQDPSTGHHIPTLEAALVSKYAALVSPYRDWEKKEYDAGDFRRMVKANVASIDQPGLSALAGQVWEGGSDDILKFVDLAQADKAFPI